MINGTKVALGPLHPEDFAPLFRWANDVDAARLNGPYRPADWPSHKDWCETIGRDASKVIFAIRRIGNPAIIGYVQIVNIHAVNRSADIGIRIGDAADRGQGYGSEALQLALLYCWNHLNLNRVALSAFKDNGRAVELYCRAGFRKEGQLRRAVYVNGKWIDVILMAILRPTGAGTRKSATARNKLLSEVPA